jgi:hypothetical protein
MLALSTTGALELTAYATLGLAGVTGVLAWLTRRSLLQTSEEIGLSRREVEEARRPVVIPFVNEPDQHVPRIEGDRLWLPVQNIGSGPALRVEASVRFLTGTDEITRKLQPLRLAGSAVGIAVAQMAWLGNGDHIAVGHDRDFEVWITFEDVAGKRWVTFSRWSAKERRYADSTLNTQAEGAFGLRTDTELVKPVPDPLAPRTPGEWSVTLVILGSMLALLCVSVINA